MWSQSASPVRAGTPSSRPAPLDPGPFGRRPLDGVSLDRSSLDRSSLDGRPLDGRSLDGSIPLLSRFRSAGAYTRVQACSPPGPWIADRRFDLLFVFASCLLVAVPLTTYYTVTWLTGVPPQSFQQNQALSIAMFINLGAAFLIGGPHMYATYTLTLAERRFREAHPWLLRAAAGIPVVVVTLTLWKIELLLFVFFGWASVHALHQVVFLVQQYQLRAPRPLPLGSRLVDYTVATTCIYPLAAWRMLAEPGTELTLPLGLTAQAGFRVGAVNVADQLPSFLVGQVWIAAAISAVFGVAFVLFLARTVFEIATGRVVWPRTLILLLTAPIALALPLFENLDVALQGFNLWHSVQYMGLVYLMNSYRSERYEVSSVVIDLISGRGQGLRYYAFIVTVSLGTGGIMGVLHFGLGLPMLQVYYCILLSALWVHYLWDHWVFQELDALTPTRS
ncbi:MAG: hypothetical protein ACQGVK_04575 [Myxococcota bacterium]